MSTLAPLIPPGFMAALHRVDPRLELKWHPGRDVWQLYERGRQTGQLHHVFDWVSEGGGYLPLPGTPDHLIKKLHAIDWARLVKNKGDLSRFIGGLEGQRRAHIEQKRAARRDIAMQVGPDLVERQRGIRQTFGPGGHRSRKGVKFDPEAAAALAEI